MAPGEQIPEVGAPHLAIVPDQSVDGGVRSHQGAVLNGGADGGQGETGVITLRVEVAHPADQAALADHRLLLEQPALAEQPMPPHIPEGGEQVVGPGAEPQLPERDPVAVMHRKDEGQGPDEVRRDLQQDAALAQRLEDEAELPVFEVAQATMHQATRAGTGAARDIMLIHQDRPEAAHRGVAGDPRPGDSPTDDQQVDGVPGQLVH